jgi:hypothetical protein
MPQRLVQILTIVLAFVGILGFAGIYGFETYKAFTRPCQSSSGPGTATTETKAQPEDIKDPYAYVATALAGLVGGVVAVMFGQPLPKSASEVNFWKAVLLTAYSTIYLLIGLVSVVAWILPKACPSVLTKTLALTFLGLLVPIVTSFFKQNSITAILGWKHEGG